MDWLYGLTKGYRKRQWAKARRQPVIRAPWKGWSQCRRIGILFDASEDRMALDAMREVVDYFKARQRHVLLCGWTGGLRPKHALYAGRQLIFIDDFTPLGKVKSGNALEFIQSEFDVIISLQRNDKLPLDDLARRASTGLRVTIGGKEDFYDLIMAEPKNLLAELIPLFEETSTWLHRIQPHQS